MRVRLYLIHENIKKKNIKKNNFFWLFIKNIKKLNIIKTIFKLFNFYINKLKKVKKIWNNK